MEREIFNKRVLPYVRYEKRIRNGKEIKVKVDNLTLEERKNMSTAPRMLWVRNGNTYMAEMPLTYRGSGVTSSLYYIFDELTSSEREKYFDRSIVIPITIEKVVKVYGDESKRVFNNTRKKVKKKIK